MIIIAVWGFKRQFDSIKYELFYVKYQA